MGSSLGKIHVTQLGSQRHHTQCDLSPWKVASVEALVPSTLSAVLSEGPRCPFAVHEGPSINTTGVWISFRRVPFQNQRDTAGAAAAPG